MIQSVWTPPPAVWPPQHQRGLSSSHNTPSVCSPVVPVRQVLPSHSSACLWSLTTHVSLSVRPQTFSSLGMLSLPVTEAQRALSFVHIRQDQIFPSAPRVHFFFPHSLCIHTVDFSSAGLCCCCCCCTVLRNNELQVDQKPLQHNTAI